MNVDQGLFEEKAKTKGYVVHALIAQALNTVRARFENPTRGPDEVLTYHNAHHTQSVICRVGKIASRMGISDRETQLAYIAAAFHDIVRTWKLHTDFAGLAVRETNPFFDEIASAREAVHEMKQYPDFSADSDCDLVTASILATVVSPGENTGSFYQPLLNKSSHPVIRVVALADLNAAAMASTSEAIEEVARDGDRLFREREMHIARTMRRIKQRSELASIDEDDYSLRMRWAPETQMNFLIDRIKRLPAELSTYKEALAPLLSIENIARVRGRVFALRELRRTMSFWDLAADMGYVIPEK